MSPQLACGWLARRQTLAHGRRVPASGMGWLSDRNDGLLLCGLAAAAAPPHVPSLASPKEMDPVLHQVGVRTV